MLSPALAVWEINNMNEVRTIEFIDADTHENGVVVVRTDKRVVSLALSLKTNGDIEVFLPLDVCRSLIDAMSQAVDDASHGNNTY